MEETIERRARGRAGAPRGGRSPRWHKAAAVFVSALLLVISAAVVRDRSALERSEHQVQLEGMTRETVTRITTVLARYADLLGNMSAASLFGDLTPEQFRGYMEAVGVGTRPGVTDAFLVASGTGADAPAGQVRYAWPSGSTFDGRDIRADADRWPLLVQSAETGLATVLAPTGAPVAEGVKTGAVLEVYGPVYPPGFFGATAPERLAAVKGWAGVSIDMDVAMQALDLGGSSLDVVMRAHGSPEFSESSPGAAAHVASADLTATEVIDLGIQRVEVTATFSPGTVTTTSQWPVGATGAAAAVAAGYAVYASLRFRRSLVIRAEAERERAELMRSRFHAAVDGAPVGILVSRLDGSTELVNERLRELVGVPAPEMPSIFEFLHPDDHADVIDSVLRMTRGEIDHLVKERRLVLRDGSRLWCRLSSSVLIGPDGEGIGLVAHVQDIEAERQAAEALAHRASHDPLTGIANRDALDAQLAPALAAVAAGDPLAVAFLDLDGMKRVNDTHGHVAGDELLRRVAGCLRLETRHSEGRPSDIVARFGGDEFVLGLRSDLFDAAAIAERIRVRLCEPMELAGVDEPVQISVSIGLAEATPHDSTRTVLHEADKALYEAKRLGRDRVVVAARGPHADPAPAEAAHS